MTSIEQKRKELEDEIKKWREKGYDWVKLHTELQGFNLGIKLARKKFLEILDNWIKKNYSHVNDENCQIIWDYQIEELKQKLGEDKT